MFPKPIKNIVALILDRFSSMIDNMKPNDLVDLGTKAGLAYVSWSTFSKGQNIPLEKHILNAVYGPLAYDLATTAGSNVFGSQQVGLIMLGHIGAVIGLNALGDVVTKATEDFKTQLQQGGLTIDESELLIKVYRATRGDYKLSESELAAWETYKKKYNK
jgi:hypothetical protein